MSFNFSIATNALFGAGKLNELHTQINAPMGVVMGKVAFGSYLLGIQMIVESCVSAHPLEYALSACHEKLPHGAGVIMISKAYYSFFVNQHVSWKNRKRSNRRESFVKGKKLDV